MPVYQFKAFRLVSGDEAPDDIAKPDPKGVIEVTLRVVTDIGGQVLEVREGATSYIEGVQNRS